MKIAMVGQRGVPAAYGGVERHVEEIGCRLAARGHQVTVFGREGYCATGSPWPGSRLVRLRNWERPAWGTAAHCLEASLRCLADPPDLIHFHATGPGACAWLTRLGSIPSVVTFHGRDWRRRRWGKAARTVLRACETLAVRGARGLVAVSPGLARDLSSRWRVRVRFVPNGVTLGPDPAPPPAGVPPRVLFLGRLVEEKGIDLLLRAFRSVDSAARLWVAGPQDGRDPHADLLRAQGALDPRVQFLGPLGAPERDRRLAECSLLVLPSEIEGMSLAAAEAMAAGRPVLASDIEENRWLLNGGGPGPPAGFLFRSGDAVDLARQLNTVLADADLLRARGLAARRRARELLDWERTVDAIEEVYAEAAPGPL
jgi:glycosyltransferase involved in cell wall biosynthesis